MVIFVLVISIHQAEGGFFSKIFKKVKNVVKKIGNAGKKIVKGIGRGLSKIGKKLKSALSKGSKFLKKTVGTLVKPFKKLLELKINLLKKLFNRKKTVAEVDHSHPNGDTPPPNQPTGPLHVVLPKLHNQLRKEEKSGSDLVSC